VGFQRASLQTASSAVVHPSGGPPRPPDAHGSRISDTRQ
jgi:hypothetical protein